MISLLMQKFQRKKVVGAAVLLLLALCGNICAQDTTRYTNALRGYEFDFSNVDFPKYPVFKWVFPASSASKMTMISALIDNVNGKDLDKLPKAEIIQLMLSEDTLEMTLRHHGCRSKEACKNPPKEWKYNWNDPNPKTFTLRQLNGPARRKHPLGECVYGDCWNGEGYVLFKPDGPGHKKGDCFKGTFKEGRPDSGKHIQQGINHDMRNGQLLENPVELAAKNAGLANPYTKKPAIDSVNAAFVRMCGYNAQPSKKVQAWTVTQPTRIVFQGNLIYEGELWGHTPQGKGKVVFEKSKVPSPLPDGYAYKMVTEGTFVYGDCQKIDRMYVDNLSGYYIKGDISVVFDGRRGDWEWYCKDCTLYSQNFYNAKSENIQKEVKVFEGNYASGQPYGSGKWYYNQYETDTLYGGYIETGKMEGGHVKDSVILVLPKKNLRKTILIEAPYLVPLENLADYVTARYLGDKRPASQWKRGSLVLPSAKEEPQKDPYLIFYEAAAKNFKATAKNYYYAEEGMVQLGGYLTEKQVHITLGSGQSASLVIFSLNGNRPEIEMSDVKEPNKYLRCPGDFNPQINADPNIKLGMTSGCSIGNTTPTKNTYTFKIKCMSAEPIYYMLMRG